MVVITPEGIIKETIQEVINQDDENGEKIK